MILCTIPSGMFLALAIGGGSAAFVAGLFAGLHFAHRIDADTGRVADLELGP